MIGAREMLSLATVYPSKHATPPLFVLAVPDAFHSIDDLEAFACEVILAIELFLIGRVHWVEYVVASRGERRLRKDPLPPGDGPIVGRNLALERLLEILEVLCLCLRLYERYQTLARLHGRYTKGCLFSCLLNFERPSLQVCFYDCSDFLGGNRPGQGRCWQLIEAAPVVGGSSQL